MILRLKHFNSSPYLFRCLSLLPKYYFPMTSLLLLKYDVFVLSTRLILLQWGWKRSSSLWQTFLFCKFSFTLSPSCCLTCRGSEEAVLRGHAGVLSRCAGLHRTGKDASAALHNCYITTRSAAVLRVFSPRSSPVTTSPSSCFCPRVTWPTTSSHTSWPVCLQWVAQPLSLLI